MKNIKRINNDGFLPTHYVVYKNTEIMGIYKTKKEAKKVMEENWKEENEWKEN